MRPLPTTSHAGVLRARAGEHSFRLSRHEPSEDLAPFVERYWIVRWDLRGKPPYPQETLPHPNVNFVIHAGRSGVFGVMTRRFSVLLEGEGQVVGTKFRPGAFYPFWGAPMSELTDRVLTLDEAFGEGSAAIEHEVLALRDTAQQIARVEAFLRPRLPPRDENVEEVGRVVRIALAHREITTARDLAARAGVPERTLQRLFRRYVGVTPKWVIQRFRLHEAVLRAEAGAAVDWAQLAIELGYFDQAHFIRDFKAHVGRPPAEHLATAAAASRA
jgi:AraC-like DNA-binding protein